MAGGRPRGSKKVKNPELDQPNFNPEVGNSLADAPPPRSIEPIYTNPVLPDIGLRPTGEKVMEDPVITPVPLDQSLATTTPAATSIPNMDSMILDDWKSFMQRSNDHYERMGSVMGSIMESIPRQNVPAPSIDFASHIDPLKGHLVTLAKEILSIKQGMRQQDKPKEVSFLERSLF